MTCSVAAPSETGLNNRCTTAKSAVVKKYTVTVKAGIIMITLKDRKSKVIKRSIVVKRKLGLIINTE